MLHKKKAFHVSLLLLVTAPNIFGAEVAVIDPYAAGHTIFGKAACKRSYFKAIEEYSKDYKEANDTQKAIARTNRGEALLAVGNIDEGFANREARLNCVNDARLLKKGQFAELSNPLTAKSNLKGATVAVYCDEGGNGDIYFFLYHYMQELRNQGVKKIIGVATSGLGKKIVQSLENEGWIDQTIMFEGGRGKLDQKTVEYDYDIHMMSLPTCLSSKGMGATTLTTIPTPPYMRGIKKLVDYWKSKIAEKPNVLHVAYCFKASPMAAGVIRKLERDIDQQLLVNTIAAASRGVQLYSIQGPDYKPVSQDIIDVAVQENENGIPFGDTAALCIALRESKNGLFVGIDTGPTNVALSTGIKGHVLLSHVHDWRWEAPETEVPSQDQTPSKWASTLKLHRQDKQGDWSAPLKTLTLELRKHNARMQDALNL